MEVNDATIAPELHLPAGSSPSEQHPRRVIRIPARYQDIQPEPSAPLPPEPGSPQHPIIRRVILRVRDSLRTATNSFGLLREYMYRPSYDPEARLSPEDLVNPSVTAPGDREKAHSNDRRPPPPWPFANMSIFRILNWMNSGSNQKSEGEVQSLLDNVISSPDFHAEEVAGVKIRCKNKQLDKAWVPNSPTPFLADDWKEVSVDITIPTLHCLSLHTPH
jgi:hypothetical protein